MQRRWLALVLTMAGTATVGLLLAESRWSRGEVPTTSWTESCRVMVSQSGEAGPTPSTENGEAPAAIPTECFVSSVGVGTHLTYGNGEYADKDAVERGIVESGVRRVRASWSPGDVENRDLAVTLGRRGVKIMFWTGQIGSDLQAVKRAIKETNALAPGTIDSIEGPNEQDDDPRLRDFVREYSSVLRNDPATADLRIYGPSLANVGSSGPYEALGDISEWVDAANVHNYPGGRMMSDGYLDEIYRYTRANVGASGPLVSSELGYSNAVDAAEQPHPAVPRDVAAVLVPRLFLEHFRRGVSETYVYELVDQSRESPWEAEFGLLDSDFKPKPAFNAVKNMQRLLADPGAAFQPTALQHSLDGADAATRTLLLQKRDGTFWLAIWQQQEVWDLGTREATVLDDVPLQLRLSERARVRTYRPVVSAKPQSDDAGTTVRLSSSASPTLVEIRPD